MAPVNLSRDVHLGLKIRPHVGTMQYSGHMILSAHQSGQCSTDELFKYTSGRWIYNEPLRLAERYLEFNVPALQQAIATATGHSTSDIASFFKMSEGGFNRLFQATFSDGKNVIARIPYSSTRPEHYAVASEAATLDYLRLHGIPTPKVYGWCSTRANPVGAEYIIMERLDGAPLGDVCIYYQKDVLSGDGIPLPDLGDREFCIGPIAHYSWGPFGERELKWATTFAKPRLPYERLYREIYGFQQASPESHIQTLQASPLDRPVMRHPDFQPNNILIAESNEIVGLIDWQHSSILPLGIAAGIPSHFQNYGDLDSEKLLEPQINLPPDFESLDPSEQSSIREIMRKRAAGTPWEGDSITLRAETIRTIQSWQILITEDSINNDKGKCTTPPFEYPNTTIQDTLQLDAQQKEADTAVEEMRDALGVDVLGWVPNEEYKAAKEKAGEIKARMLEAAETPRDVTAIQYHFPFDDFDEKSLLFVLRVP
ncbi:kinase-like domain-containing protein [Aspergillus carlsbadensis]|nr:kinase-like domain-containing protein [Aspergillus carlsbadensis]